MPQFCRAEHGKTAKDIRTSLKMAASRLKRKTRFLVPLHCQGKGTRGGMNGDISTHQRTGVEYSERVKLRHFA